ncbi:mucin-associated surface protein [Cryobacterium sp. PH31-O1]|uniref:mucin-associated surface protein n=1 Tax=Cryobacterium sp. PH31-O1 TaxID=3046306 RepID=UPI0024BB7345|nr:mucin-associated surface protein [Cryobacterium sp. PH31-O1]MDJ0339433.1 mucin-associated surface protein [Cryobacterium sp. PH31-O1]
MIRRHRLTLVAAVAVGLLLPLAGCAADPVDLQASTAESLQGEILQISEAAAAGDFASAQTLLTAMQENLQTATASGQVNAERSASIQSAINSVRDDLTVEIDAAVVAAAAAALAAEEAAALAAKQNDEDAQKNAEQAKEDAEKAREAAKDAAEDAKEAREDCPKDKDKAGECN